MLLRLEGVHLDGQFRGRDQVGHEQELPAAQLRAIAQVEVFGQRVVLPAARVADRRAAPHAGRAVEVEEATRPVARAVLEHEVAVEQHRLDFRQERVVLIEMAPARLHERKLRIREVADRPPQEVGRRHEVGVEDRDELAARGLEPRVERARLEARAIRPVQVLDVEPARRLPPHRELRDVTRLVGRIVQDLDLELVLRIVDRRHRVDQAIDDVHLVVEGKLDRDDRPLVHRRRRTGHAVAMLHVLVDEIVPVPSVEPKDAQHEKVGDKNQCIRRDHRMESLAGSPTHNSRDGLPA